MEDDESVDDESEDGDGDEEEDEDWREAANDWE